MRRMRAAPTATKKFRIFADALAVVLPLTPQEYADVVADVWTRTLLT